MEQKEFSEKIVQVHRVSKKTKGGNKIGFSVVLVVGNKKGQVGVGLGKAPDVKSAIKKGVRYAKKHLITIPMTPWGTIPHDIYLKLGAAKILLRRAPEGTGVIAGGAIRAVVEAAGVRNIVSKVLGTSNQASNVYATLEALKRLKPVHESIGKIVTQNDPSSLKATEGQSSETVNDGKQGNTVEKPISVNPLEIPARNAFSIADAGGRVNPEENKTEMTKKVASKKIKRIKTTK